MKLESPDLFDVTMDPKETRNMRVKQSWVTEPMQKMPRAFQESPKRFPLIAPGRPD